MAKDSAKRQKKRHRHSAAAGGKDKQQQQQHGGVKREVDEKRQGIIEAIKKASIPRLVQYAATPGGLLDNEQRRRAWPILLHCTDQYLDREPNGLAHIDEHQIQLDVDRSLTQFVDVTFDEKTLAIQRSELNKCIVAILKRAPSLSYYQGFHDVVAVLLLTLGPDLAIQCGEKLALFFHRYPF